VLAGVFPALAATLLLLGGAALGGEAPKAEPAQAGAPRSWSLWPLVSVYRSPPETEVEVLGPLGFYHRTPEAVSWGVRPFFTITREPERGRTVRQFLYPLSYFRRDPDRGRQYAFPLYYRSWGTAGGKQPQRVTVLFPFFWWGHSAGGGAWFVVPFVGGVCRGLLGQDEILHVSWLYNRASWRGYVQHHVLWPFFSWASDGEGHRSLRIWPLYGRAEQEGKWWNGYVLWPFVTYGRRQATEHQGAADYWMLWPLFGRARGADGKSGNVTVLWPFFRYAWNAASGFRQWGLPWPIVVGSRQPGVKSRNVWPLWGTRRWATGSESYYLWPFVHTQRVRGTRVEVDDVKVFPFFTARTSRRTEPASRRVFRLLWPLWRSRRAERGGQWRTEANSLQFAWFGNPEHFDRTYNALLGLFEREASSDGRRATRLLWRLFRFERGEDYGRVQLGPLFTRTRSGSLTRYSFLLGLVQTGQRDGRRGWRIFYLPFGASLSQASSPPDEEPARGR
jgi:hypothetical protein